jgi:tetratricopeptide (TPR) repeat protein
LRLLVAVHVAVALGYVALRTHVVGRVAQEPISAAVVAGGLRDAPWLLAHYLWISVWPFGHSMAYRVPPATTVQFLVSAAALAAALAVSWRWRRNVAVGLLWFIASLALVVHLVPLHADVADRFALLPTVGLALALATAVAPLSRRVTVLLGALLIIYAAAYFVEERAWHSDSLLWRYAVDRQPDAPMARENLATVLMAEGRIDEAVPQVEALHALGWTRIDLEIKRAYVLARAGRGDEAARAIAGALRIDPGSGVAHAVAGQLAFAAGDVATAAREHEAARRLAPAHPATGLLGYELLHADDERVDYLRALQALSFDDVDGATRAARACLRRSPGRPQCEAALGRALTVVGPLDDEARALLDRCIAAVPDAAERQRCREAEWGAQ